MGATAGTFHYTYTDHLGNVVAVGNASGGLEANSYAAYEPFGAFMVQPSGTNPSITDRGFTGHKHNNLAPVYLGLIYMNARYYHPQLGRFISPDTIVPNPENPQSYNRYSYVRNSPLNFTDPTGHRECGPACQNDLISQQELQFHALSNGAEWDPAQQAANSAKADTIITGAVELVAGLWEPTDWGIALSDGFQWHDSIGMVPLIPASVGRYADEVLDLLGSQGDNIVYRALRADERRGIADGLFGRSWPADDGSPVSHVAGQTHSPWISTGTQYEKIREKFDSGNGIAVIDLSKVTSRIVDFSNGIPGMEGSMLSNWAKSVGEKLVKDFIPPEAILRIID